MTNATDFACDVLVVGSGASGMAAALSAHKNGLDVIVIEKEKVFGGSTALSGGWSWVPCNPLAEEAGVQDSRQDARRYIEHEAGNHFDGPRVDMFLDNAPRMVRFMETETAVRFILGMIPDYHAESPGGSKGGRAIGAAPFDARALGERGKSLAPPIRGMTFVGLMFGSGPDMRHFMNALRSLDSFLYTAKRLSAYGWDLLTHGRNMKLFNGAALAARLHKTAMDWNIPVWLSAPMQELIIEDGRVVGARIERDGRPVRVRATKGVVLASGGFPNDIARRQQAYPHHPAASDHISMAPDGNTGDGLRAAEAAGGAAELSYPNLGSWMPVSRVPLGGGRQTKVLHIMDRGKPGIVAVRADGRRFTNEGANYHDFGAAMVKDGRALSRDTFLIGDHRAVRAYGMGFAKPFPVPLGLYIRSGYLTKADTLEELAQKTGIDGHALAETVARFNAAARRGVDPDFHKGEFLYDQFQGDPAHRPSPNIGPLEIAPFYAVRMVPGDIGTFGGIKVDKYCRVLDARGAPIVGLHAVGNDAASIFGGAYPGGGATLGPGMTFGYVVGRYLAGILSDADPKQSSAA